MKRHEQVLIKKRIAGFKNSDSTIILLYRMDILKNDFKENFSEE